MELRKTEEELYLEKKELENLRKEDELIKQEKKKLEMKMVIIYLLNNFLIFLFFSLIHCFKLKKLIIILALSI